MPPTTVGLAIVRNIPHVVFLNNSLDDYLLSRLFPWPCFQSERIILVKEFGVESLGLEKRVF